MKKLIGLVVVMLIGMGCETGSGEKEVPYVAGVYEITEGTLEMNGNGEQVIDDVTGYLLTVSSNGYVISAGGCLGVIQTDGVLKCDGTEIHDVSMFGVYMTEVSGSIKFGTEDGKRTLETDSLRARMEIGQMLVVYSYKLKAQEWY